MNSKRILSMVLSMVLLFSNVLAAPIITVVDMPTGWSQPAVTEAVENGILTVENGEIRPMEPLTRAEMAEGITNAFGATEKASLSAYTDVPATKWYYEAMQKAVAMGIISGYGNGLIKPEKKITREEMFTVIYNALELEDGNLYFLNKFNDKNLVSDWAKFIVARMVQNNFVSGNAKGNIKPTESITREEFAQVMKNIFAEYYNVPGTYTNIPAGNIIVSTPDVVLKDATVTGDLIIADGVGIGEVTLDNVTVLGRTIVRGGGENSIKLINNTTLNGNLIVNNNISRVRIYNQKSQVKNIEVRTPAILEGDFENVKVTKSTQVETKGNINKITVDEKSDLMVTSGTVEQIDVKNTAAATVISGKGKVTQVNANANDVTVSTSKTQVTAASNVTGVVAGKVSVEAGKTATVKSSSGGGGGGGGGGSSSGGGGGGSSSSKVTIPTLKLTDIENGGKIDLGANYGKFEVSYVYEDGYQTKWYTPTAKVLTESNNDVAKGWTSKTTTVKVKYGTSEKQLTIRPETPSFNVNKDGELVIPNFEQVKSNYEAKIDFLYDDFIGQYKTVESMEDLKMPTIAEEYLHVRLKATNTMLASYPFAIDEQEVIVESISEVKYDGNNMAYRKIGTDYTTYIVTAENKNDKYLCQLGEGKTLFDEEFGIIAGDILKVYDIPGERANIEIDEEYYVTTDITNVVSREMPEFKLWNLRKGEIEIGADWEKYQVAYGDTKDVFDTENIWKDIVINDAPWYENPTPNTARFYLDDDIGMLDVKYIAREEGGLIQPIYFGIRLKENTDIRQVIQVRQIAEVEFITNNGYHTAIKVGEDYEKYSYYISFEDAEEYYGTFTSSELVLPKNAFVGIEKRSQDGLREEKLFRSEPVMETYKYEPTSATLPDFKLNTRFGFIDLGNNAGKYEYSTANREDEHRWYVPTSGGYNWTQVENLENPVYINTYEAVEYSSNRITIKDIQSGKTQVIDLTKYLQNRPEVEVDYEEYRITVDGDYTIYEYRNLEEGMVWHTFSDTDAYFDLGDVIEVRLKGTDTKLAGKTKKIEFSPKFEEEFVTGFDIEEEIIEIGDEEYQLSENVIVKIFGYDIAVGVNAIDTILSEELNCVNANNRLNKSILAGFSINGNNEITEINFKFSVNDYQSTIDEDLQINEFFVEKVSSKGNITVMGNSFYDDLDDYSEVNPIVMRNGEVTDVYDIYSTDVVTEVIYASKVKRMYISDLYVRGTLEKYSDNKNEFTINNVDYKVIDVPFYNMQDNIRDCIASDANNIFDIFKGQEVEAYLNMAGEVVAIIGDVDMPKLGVITTKAVLETDEDDIEYLTLKILNENGEIERYKIYNTEVDGNWSTTGDITDAQVYKDGIITESTLVENKVIRFITDETNEIMIGDISIISGTETGLEFETSSNVDVEIAEELVVDYGMLRINGHDFTVQTKVINPYEMEIITYWQSIASEENGFVETIEGTNVYIFTAKETGGEFAAGEIVYIVAWIDGDNYANAEEKYGIVLSDSKNTDGSYFVELLVEGDRYAYDFPSDFRNNISAGDFISFTVSDGKIRAYADEYVSEEIIEYIDGLDTNATEIDLSSYTNLTQATSIEAITVAEENIDTDDKYIVFADNTIIDLADDYIVYSLEDQVRVGGVEEGDYVLFAGKNDDGAYSVVIVLDGGYEYVPIPTFISRDYWYKGETDKSDITKIVITNTGNRPEFDDDTDYWYAGTENEDAYWYAGTENEDDILCYILDNVLYIDGNGNREEKIMANENSKYMFRDFSSVEEIQGLDLLDTSNVTDMSHMFDECKSLQKIDLSKFDTSNVEDMSLMFWKCKSLSEVNVSKFDTSNVEDMSLMFGDCNLLKEIDLSNFDTSNVTDMSDMFLRCESLREIDVSNFNTSNVIDMCFMFEDCKTLEKIDLSNFDTKNVTDMYDMFEGCNLLNEIKFGNKFVLLEEALSSPSPEFIEGATGLWYDEVGNSYTIGDIMERHSGEKLMECTYYATNVSGVDIEEEEPYEENKNIHLSWYDVKSSDGVPQYSEIVKKIYDPENTDVPEKYRLDDEFDIPIDNQKNLGLCNGFAIVNSVETNYALNNSGEYIDLSERYLDYMTSKDFLGDRESGVVLYSGDAIGDIETFGFLEAFGLPTESEVPYDNYTAEELESKEINTALRVTSTVTFPDIQSLENKVEWEKLVKMHIMKYGSLRVAYKASSMAQIINNKITDGYPNHAISIVGWDDTYSKDNFTPDASRDGAWICLNSWGDDWGMFDGYCYMSYDSYIDDYNTLMGVLKVKDFEKNIQYTYANKLVANEYEEYEGNNSCYGVKFDKVNDTEYFSHMTISGVSAGKVKCYLNPYNDSFDKENMIYLGNVDTVGQRSRGYDLLTNISLDEPIEIVGNTFSVVFEFCSDYKVDLAYDEDGEPITGHVYYAEDFNDEWKLCEVDVPIYVFTTTLEDSEETTYTVNLNSQGATEKGTESVEVVYGNDMPQITIPTRVHTITFDENGGREVEDTAVTYTFNGYYTGTNGSGEQYYTATGASAKQWDISGNRNLYAYWTSEGIQLPIPTRDGYEFDGWYDGERYVGWVYYLYKPAEDEVLTAHWYEYEPESILEEESIEEPVEEPIEEPVEEPTEEPVEEPVEEPIEEPVEEPTEEPVEEPVEEPIEEPVEEPTEEPVEEPVEEPIEEPTEEPVEEPVEEPIEEPVEEPTEEPVEEPVEEPIEEPTEEPVEEPVEEPIEEPVEEPIEEPVEEAEKELTDGKL